MTQLDEDFENRLLIAAFVIAMIIGFIVYNPFKNEEVKQTEEPRHIYDGTIRKLDGDPIGTHRDRDGNLWSDNNIWAPKEGQSLSDPEFQSNASYAETPEDAYHHGYNQGYEDGESDREDDEEWGENYDDESSYYDYYETQYKRGYKAGYNDGYDN